MQLLTGIFLLIAAVLLVAIETEAAVSRGIFKDPAHPGKCVVDGLVLNDGQSARHPKMCARVVCGKNSEGQIQTCGVVGLLPGQKFGKYKAPNADYPDCCDREILKA
ncbi:uncharacterized protein LOC111076874 [Drosophila obscura]|uniref:uncharacterized protein LOC111076874 n=1 Tax=Drosophila obscura TaxID=7282 RepID=UPI001BB19E12|nr:uncharacterized protein LOC111076874 [Drosophila obscura]